MDTSVLVEYLDEASPLARKVETLFEKALRGEIRLYTTSLVIAVLLYVASRLYREAGIQEPNQRAYEYIVWLRQYLGLEIADIDYRLALEMGEVKKRTRLALTDCSIIAYAKTINATPLFRRVEREMEPVLDVLREEVKIMFLEDLNIQQHNTPTPFENLQGPHHAARASSTPTLASTLHDVMNEFYCVDVGSAGLVTSFVPLSDASLCDAGSIGGLGGTSS